MDLRVGYLTGCMLVSRRAWDSLTHDDQQSIESAAAKLQMRLEDATKQIDSSLMSGLFARQGMQMLPVPPALQSEFAAAAREAQKQAEKLSPPGTLEQIATWLAEYRSSHKNDKH
jgi:TRAP-type C4-dicarboxylate transport system substrate-binding protein